MELVREQVLLGVSDDNRILCSGPLILPAEEWLWPLAEPEKAVKATFRAIRARTLVRGTTRPSDLKCKNRVAT